MSPTRALTPNSGSSNSSGDYRPLASLTQAQTPVTAKSSSPRKRRKMLCKPGKVMKDAYFKGIQWTRAFVSGRNLILCISGTNFTVRYVRQTYLSTPTGPAKNYDTIRLRDIYGEIKGGGMNTSLKWIPLQAR